MDRLTEASAGLGVPAATAIIATLDYRLLSSWLPFLLVLSLVAVVNRRTSKACGGGFGDGIDEDLLPQPSIPR